MKKKKLVRSLLASVTVLALAGAAFAPAASRWPVVAAETVQPRTYQLTDEEKAALSEYTHAKLTLEMQAFSLAFFQEMMKEMGTDEAKKIWNEELTEVKASLDEDGLALLDKIQSTLLSSIRQHYHYLNETLTVLGKSSREEAAAIVAKFEEEAAKEADEKSAPEVELAVLLYSKELIIERLEQNSKAIDNYIADAEKNGKKLADMLASDSLDLETLEGAVISYGQDLAVASQPKYQYDFAELDMQIEALKAELAAAESGTGTSTDSSSETPASSTETASSSENAVPTPPSSSSNSETAGTSSSSTENQTGASHEEEDETSLGLAEDTDRLSGAGQQIKVTPRTKSVKVLPKTASQSTPLLAGLGLAIAGLATAMIYQGKKKEQ